MRLRMTTILTAGALCTVALLPGCAGSDQTMGSLMVAPGAYSVYNCKQLSDAIISNDGSLKAQEELMAKAGTGLGGQLANAVGYRTDYLVYLGKKKELERAWRERDCKPVESKSVDAAKPKTDAAVPSKRKTGAKR